MTENKEMIEIVVVSSQQPPNKKKLGYSDAVDIVGSDVIKPLSKIIEITPEQKEDLTKKAGRIIKSIANNLSETFNEIDNAKEMEIEFGLAFNEKLGLRIFEIGSTQSIRVKLKFYKKPANE